MDSDRWLVAWGFGSVALGGASLLVPLYIVELGADPFALGILAATAAFAGVPGALLVGRVADRTGRRRGFVLGGLALVAAVLALVPLTDSVPLIIAANAVLWFASAAVAPVLSLLIVANVPEHEWGARYARLNQYQGYGWAGGLVLGAVWVAVATSRVGAVAAQRTFFGACAVAAAGGLVLAARWLPPDGAGVVPGVESRKRERFARALGRARRLNVRGATFPFAPGRLYWTTRSFDPRTLAERFTTALAIYYGAVVLFFTGFAAFFAPLPLYLVGQGFGSGTVFALYLVSSLGAAAFYGRSGVLAERHDLPLLQAAGLVARGVSLPLVALVGATLAASLTGLVAMGVVFVAIGVAWAVIAVTAATLVTRLAPAALRGEAMGLYVALSAVAGGVGSVLGGTLAGGAGYGPAFAVAGGLVLAGAGIVALLRRRPTPEGATERATAED